MTLEAHAIKIPGNILIVACYKPPQNNIDTNELTSIFKLNNKVLIVGELNSKHTSWHCKRANASRILLFKYL